MAAVRGDSSKVTATHDNYVSGTKRRESQLAPSHCIVVEDYLVYYDIIYNGNEVEKARLSFLMLDLEATGLIYEAVYERFWRQQLSMYGEVINIKVSFDDEIKDMTRKAFMTIANGAKHFDLDMF